MKETNRSRIVKAQSLREANHQPHRQPLSGRKGEKTMTVPIFSPRFSRMVTVKGKKYMKILPIKIEHCLFLIGSLLFLFSSTIAKWIFRLVYLSSQQQDYVIRNPLEYPLVQITEFLVITAFVLMVISVIIFLAKVGIRKRKRG